MFSHEVAEPIPDVAGEVNPILDRVTPGDFASEIKMIGESDLAEGVPPRSSAGVATHRYNEAEFKWQTIEP